MRRTSRALRILGRLLCDRMAGVSRSSYVVAAVVPAMHLAPSLAWAQKRGRLPAEGQGWLPWAIAGGIIVVMCVAGFLNPKRSHLG